MLIDRGFKLVAGPDDKGLTKDHIPFSEIDIQPITRYTVQNSKGKLGMDCRNPFTEETLLAWLETNIYNSCTCLDVNRNPVSR